MATFTVYRPVVAGTAVTEANASGTTDDFVNTGSERIFVRPLANIGATATLTLVSQGSCSYGTSAHNVNVTITNGNCQVIGPFEAGRWNDANGKIQLSWSGGSTWANLKVVVLG